MVKRKTCSKCGTVKDLNEFVKHKKLPDGHTCVCKACRNSNSVKYSSKIKEYNRKHYLENKASYSENSKKYYQKNKEAVKQNTRQYAHRNKDKVKAKKKEYDSKNRIILNLKKTEYWAKNPERRKQIRKKSFNKNPYSRLKRNLRNRIYRALTAKSWRKNNTTEQILGIDFTTVRIHIESLFKPGMTWENYGHGADKWHVDHKMPLAVAKSSKELVELCHYTNLQPLWSKDNLSKGAKIVWHGF